MENGILKKIFNITLYENKFSYIVFLGGFLTYSYCHKLSLSALSKSIDNLNNRLNSALEKKIISQNIDKLSVKFLACN